MNVPLQDLIGKVVRDADGKKVGRIFEVMAEIQGDACVVTEWLLGTHALLARLGMTASRLLGLPRREPDRIPWDRMDLSDPKKPRLKRTSS